MIHTLYIPTLLHSNLNRQLPLTEVYILKYKDAFEIQNSKPFISEPQRLLSRNCSEENFLLYIYPSVKYLFSKIFSCG